MCLFDGFGDVLGGQLILGSHNGFNALGRSQRLAPHGQNTGDGHHGVEDDGEIGQKRRDGTRAAQATVDTPGTHQNHQHQSQIEGQVHGGLAGCHHHVGLVFIGHDLPVNLFESHLFTFAAAQSLDDPDTRSIFPHHAHHGIHRLLQVIKKRNGTAGNKKHDGQNDGQHTGEHQCQHRLQGDGDDNPAHNQNGRTNADALHHAHHPVDVVGVGGHAGDQAGNSETVNLPVGQVGDLAEQVVTQPPRGLPGNPSRHPVGNHIAQNGKDGAHQHDHAPFEHQTEILQGHDLVNDVGQNIGQEQIHDGTGEFDHQTQAHALQIGTDIAKNQMQVLSPSSFLPASIWL